jgi:hypothetical protein
LESQAVSKHGKTFSQWLGSRWPMNRNDLNKKLERIIMNQVELSAALDKLTEQVGKVAKEQSDRFDALTAEVTRLTDLINAGTVTPEVAAALTNVQTAMDRMDDAVPDAPV